MEAVYMGVSQSRNPNLAAVFYRLGLVESYGTGIRKMIRLYRNTEKPLVFRSAEGGFLAELHDRNDRFEYSFGRDMDTGTMVRESSYDDVHMKIYNLAKEKGKITRKEVEDEFGFGSTKAYKILLSLCDAGLLVQKKHGKLTVYDPVGKNQY